MSVTPEPSLTELVVKLTAAVETLSARYDADRAKDAELRAQDARNRRTDRHVRALIAIVVAALAAGSLLYYFVELPARRADSYNRVRDLACYAVRLRPPGQSQSADELRAKYDCPPYDPSVQGAPSSTSTPTGSITGTPHADAPSPRSSTTPTALPSSVRTSAASTPRGRTANRSSTAPAPRSTPRAARPPSTAAHTLPAPAPANRTSLIDLCPIIRTSLTCPTGAP